MTHNKPLVSGIIIFLNAETFFKEAIESVFAQSYDNWELLLVDDGSTDGSSEIALRYAERHPGRVRYLEHEGHRNLGKSVSRNLGVRSARGEFIVFLDADDIWLPHKLTDQVAIFCAHPEAAMLYGRTRFWFSWSGKPEDRHRDYPTDLGIKPDAVVNPPALLRLILRKEHATPSTCSVMLRREIFDAVGGFEDDFRDMYEDLVLYAKIFLNHPVFVAGQCWDHYRQHSRNSCAMAIKAGYFDPDNLNPARLRYLRWVEQYLFQQGVTDQELLDSLERELRPYRHPFLHRLLRRGQRLLKREMEIRELTTWIGDLERGKAWLEEQRANWQRIAEERERIILTQQAWIAELERGKAWLEAERATWQQPVGTRETVRSVKPESDTEM